MVAPIFQPVASNIQFEPLLAPDKVQEESCSKFQGPLLPHTEHPDKHSLHVFVQHNISTPATTTKTCSTSWAFPTVHGQKVLNSCFLRRVVSSDQCVIYIQRFVNTQTIRILGTEKPREIYQHEIQVAKGTLTLWCAVHDNDVIGPHHITSKTFEQVDYYEMLNSYVRSETQYFPQNAAFQQDGAPPQITRAVHCFSNKTFPISWTRRYGVTNWPARASILTILDVFHLGFVKNKMYRTFSSCLWVPTVKEDWQQ